MKLCIDCKFFKKFTDDISYAKCLKQLEIKTERSPIDGSLIRRETHNNKFCELNRECEELCGKDAKWFEPKDNTQKGTQNE